MAPTTTTTTTTTTTNVQVALRIRPITPQDAVSIPTRFQRIVIHGTTDATVSVDAVASIPQGAPSAPVVTPVSSANKKQGFTFDQVHDAESTQYSIYTSTAKPLIDRFIEGFNCTILAYGQTSSGKTYTMTGVDLDGDPSDSSNGMGIIPRSIAEIFDRINRLKSAKKDTWKASVKGSFIEIYNEDLIDLLSSDDPNMRRDVQIREDKEGNILWEGLREIPVRTVSDVMDLIRQGTAIRRTNETQMNAQSSRSHAIFSLTLTQKRYTGSGPPPRSSSPLPPHSSPSRLARPGSMYTSPTSHRSGSPTFNRPLSAMSRAPQHLRPHSSLGHSEDNRLAPTSAAGEWVTITSKFHFVDLAGSERLKRTAAAGERIKEGISINSGLLALGNVISALGDVSKSRITTHIPYRDSKLTRLLQDSLGGNAHTLMIACVSPVEWNVGETVNTLKYANRARNIRNKARIDEKEEGWEDVEWLQNTVVKLRKELKAIKSGSVLPEGDNVVSGDKLSNSAKQVREQLAELQTQYVELRQRFTDRTEELTRLRREAGENMRRSGGTVGGVGRYEEIVGPVIEEYEKTISSMEAELSLNRAALRHTNDILTEKEDELNAELERHATTEAYVEELRGRVAKLSERETSTEAYIQDLEERIKGFSSSSLSTSESISALQKDLAKFKELESTNATYIAGLEARLSKSEENVLNLRQSVAEAETHAEQRAHDVQALELKLAHLTSDEQGWRSELEKREEKVKALEMQMKEWESVRNEAALQRERLGGLVSEVEDAKKDLDVSSRPSSSLGMTRPSSPIPVLDAPTAAQLQALQETHAATLLDLESVTTQYKDALREISDLAAQLEEAKLEGEAVPLTIKIRDDSAPLASSRRKASINRRDSTDSTVSPTGSPSGRRVFFRQAIAADPFPGVPRSHSQSLSLSQEFASGRSQQRLMPNNGLRHQRSESLLTSLRPNGMIHSNLSLPSGANDRSVDSLEQEIMRLQEVIREREAEIVVLENSVQKSQVSPDSEAALDLKNRLLHSELSELRDSLQQDLANGNNKIDTSDKRTSIGRFDELMRSMAQKESQHQEVVDSLTQQLQLLRRQHDDLNTLSRDQAHNMSNELESLRKIHDQALEELQVLRLRDAQLNATIASGTKQHNEERELLIQEHSKELFERLERIQKLTSMLKAAPTPSQLNEAEEALSKAREEIVKSKEEQRSLTEIIRARNDALSMALKEKDEAMDLKTQLEFGFTKLKAETEEQVKKARDDSAEALRRSDEEYYLAVSKLRGQHEEVLRVREEKAQQDLDRLRNELEAQMRQAELARRGSLAESQTTQAEAIDKLQAEHATALARVRKETSADMECLRVEHAKSLDGLRTEHAERLNKLKSQHVALNSVNQQLREDLEQLQGDLKSQYEAKLAALQAERSKELEVLRAHVHDLETEIVRLTDEHFSAMEQANKDHETSKENLLREHLEDTAQYRLEHQDAISDLEGCLLAKEEELKQALHQSKQRHEQLIAEERDRFQTALREAKQSQEDEKLTWDEDKSLLTERIDSLNRALHEATTSQQRLRNEKETVSKNNEVLYSSYQDTLKSLDDARKMHEDMEARFIDLKDEHGRTVQSLQTAEYKYRAAQEAATIAEKSVAEMQSLKTELQNVTERAKQLAKEKVSSESTIRDLQTQLSALQNRLSAALAQDGSLHRPVMERTLSHPRSNGLPPAKLPPLSPPPSIPPPPLPATAVALQSESGHASISSVSSRGRQSTGSHETHETIPTSTGSVNGILDEVATNGMDQTQLQLIGEQEAMIKTLNKQLAHCETDLQAHIDLVTTLESSLNDSERNLRKARQQSNELSRERDSLSRQLDASRNEVREIQRELANARQSVIEQTQSLESRLDEERRAKDRARAQLDARMEELQKRKSKFACM